MSEYAVGLEWGVCVIALSWKHMLSLLVINVQLAELDVEPRAKWLSWERTTKSRAGTLHRPLHTVKEWVSGEQFFSWHTSECLCEFNFISLAQNVPNVHRQLVNLINSALLYFLISDFDVCKLLLKSTIAYSSQTCRPDNIWKVSVQCKYHLWCFHMPLLPFIPIGSIHDFSEFWTDFLKLF